jgi:hypothetical protein
MKHHDGEFVSVTDEALTLHEKGSDVLVKREDVRVWTASGARRGEHAVIGLVVGGLTGVLHCCRPTPWSTAASRR